MGFNEGQIILNSANATYFPGQTIEARMVFDQDKVKKFRGIYAKLKGYCDVRWTTSHTRKDRDGHSETYHITHESHEEYINLKVYLIGGESGEHEIGAGSYDYSFKFVLPPNLPSSFEGSYGHIRYKLKVVVDRALKIDQEQEEDIRVIVPIDLNVEPYCKEPMSFQFEDTYCCCCMSSGTAETVVKLPVSGYCPGQVVPVELTCQTSGPLEMNTIKLIMKKTTTYRATTNPDEKHTKNILAEIKKGPVPKNTSRNWTVEMIVPDIDIHNLSGCRFIDIDYEFIVKIKPGGCHSKTEGSKRLVIGTIPLVGYQLIYNVPNRQQDQMPMITVSNVNHGLSAYPIQAGDPGMHPTYPSSNPPYPGAISPYPGDKSSYPGSTSPYPAANPPYPGGTSPYQTANPPYPGGTSPYPEANPPYPVANPPYPGGTSPYPAGNPPYPVSNSSYPGGNTPVPTANPSYPTNDSPYAVPNPPYPHPNPPYPNAVPPYPTENSPFLPNVNTSTTGSDPPVPIPISPRPYNISNNSNRNPTSSTPIPNPYPAKKTSPFSNNTTPPYPPQLSPNPVPGLRTGTIGFMVPLPSYGTVSPISASPYATASAPPDTPDEKN